MKKLLATGVALLLVASLTAQISFGPRVGFNLTNMTESDESGSLLENSKFRPGFQVGFVVGIPLVGDLLTIQPGLLFATQGLRMSESESETFMGQTITTELDMTLGLNYLQMPIDLQLGFDVGRNARVMVQAGPYLGFALSGNMNIEYSTTMFGQTETETIDESVEFGSGSGEMNRLDFGVGFGAGVQFGRIQVGASYNLGLANLSNEEGTTTRNNGLALTVTYLFGGR